MEIPYIITEYCWHFIEEDLVIIKKYLMQKKSKHAVYSFDAELDTDLKRKEAMEFCQELNSIAAEKFRTISSWFNKPSIASPSADLVLLFNAVLSETKDCFPNFSPNVIVDKTNFKISGGTYFAIYDALYILIYNAALYGKDNGDLQFTIKPHIEGQVIRLSISSDSENQVEFTRSKNLINTTLSEDFKNAHTFEGRSGIKKLRQMEHDNYIDEVSYSFFDNKIIASFDFQVEL